MQSKNIFSTWLPCIQHWFSSLNSMQPFGQGWAFLPFNKPLAYFRAKMPTPALMAAYCFMRKTSSSCRATNYIQFFSLLQSFFSVYIHHISVILLNKRTFLPGRGFELGTFRFPIRSSTTKPHLHPLICMLQNDYHTYFKMCWDRRKRELEKDRERERETQRQRETHR